MPGAERQQRSILQPKGCEERATVVKRPHYITNPEGVAEDSSKRPEFVLTAENSKAAERFEPA